MKAPAKKVAATKKPAAAATAKLLAGMSETPVSPAPVAEQKASKTTVSPAKTAVAPAPGTELEVEDVDTEDDGPEPENTRFEF